MLVVDPWHWLDEHGEFPTDDPRLFRQVLRVAQLIEYGGPLEPLHTRETLLQCKRRPAGKQCPGLIWVVKTSRDEIHAHCLICRQDEALVDNWQRTSWANGPMEPVRVEEVKAEDLH